MKTITKFKSVFLMFFTVLAFSSCSSSSDSKCEEDDFGYLRLTIPSSANRTAVTYTLVGNPAVAGDQTIAANRTSAKLEIPSGTYTFAVEQINSNGESVSDPVVYTNVVIEQCETVSKTIVSFDN